MTKSLMLSIQPKHLVNILNGNKTLELRKTVPKDFKGWVYIYCTKGKHNLIKVKNRYVLEKGNRLDYDLNSKVVARFWFDEYDTYSIEKPVNNLMVLELNNKGGLSMDGHTQPNLINKSCVDINDIWDYAKPSKNSPDKQRWVYAWHIHLLEIFDEPLELSDFIVGLNYLGDIIPPTYKKLKKAPQSWQYVYTKEE